MIDCYKEILKEFEKIELPPLDKRLTNELRGKFARHVANNYLPIEKIPTASEFFAILNKIKSDSFRCIAENSKTIIGLKKEYLQETNPIILEKIDMQIFSAKFHSEREQNKLNALEDIERHIKWGLTENEKRDNC